MNIKTVIYFLLICSLPVASASTLDNIWAARSSGFIGSNDTLIFEDYIIKAKPTGDKKASITVYKNQNKIEQRNFNITDIREYDNIRVTLLGIKGEYSWIAISISDTKATWRPLSSKLLKWGEIYTIENYTVHAEIFGPASVNLTISNKSMEETRVFSKNSFSDHDNLRIVVKNIDPNGFVYLEFLTNTMPVIKADISTDKDRYTPDEAILVTVNISNDIAWNIAGIDLESSTDAEIKPDVFSSTDVTGIRSFQSRITQLPAGSTIIINATIKAFDYYNNEYTTKISRTIHTTHVISITKRVPADVDQKNVTVELYVYNAGQTEESISIYDTIPEELASEAEKLNWKMLNWSIKLKPKDSTNISYYISPQRLGQYVLPPAVAKWKDQSSASEEAVMTVHGPLITMTKSASKRNNLTYVDLVITNSGDRPAMVDVSDKIPDGYPVMSGNTTWSGLLDGGESAVIMYSISGDADVLPAASAAYRDIYGVIKETKSNIVEMTGLENDIYEGDSSPLNLKPDVMLSFMVSSFLVIAGIITGVAVIACLAIRLKRS